MATGVTLTASMISASIADLQSRLDKLQSKNLGADGDFSTFFEEAAIKNEIAKAEYEAEEAGLTAADQAKKEHEQLALHYSSVSQQRYDYIMTHGIQNQDDVFALSTYLEDKYGSPENVPPEIRQQAVSNLMDAINSGKADPRKTPDFMVGLVMEEVKEKLKKNDDHYANLTTSQRKELEAVVNSGDKDAMRELLAKPEFSQAIGQDLKIKETSTELNKFTSDLLKSDEDFSQYIIESRGLSELNDSEKNEYISNLTSEDITRLAQDYSKSEAYTEHFGSDLGGKGDLPIASEYAAITAEDFTINIGGDNFVSKEKDTKSAEDSPSVDDLQSMFAVKEPKVQETSIEDLSAMFANADDPLKAQEAIAKTEAIKHRTEAQDPQVQDNASPQDPKLIASSNDQSKDIGGIA